MLTEDTYADPNPIQKGSVVKFHVGGMWTHPMQIANVRFECYLYDAKVFDEALDCNGDASCPNVVLPGSPWNAEFDFQVPGVAPDTEFDVKVIA